MKKWYQSQFSEIIPLNWCWFIRSSDESSLRSSYDSLFSEPCRFFPSEPFHYSSQLRKKIFSPQKSFMSLHFLKFKVTCSKVSNEKWFLWEFFIFSVKEKWRNNRLLCHVTQIRSPLFHFSLLRISIFIFFFIFTDLEIKCRIYWKTEKDFWSGQQPNQWLKRKITGKLHFHPIFRTF